MQYDFIKLYDKKYGESNMIVIIPKNLLQTPHYDLPPSTTNNQFGDFQAVKTGDVIIYGIK